MKNDDDFVKLTDSIAKKIREFLEPYRVECGDGFRLSDHNPGDTAHLKKRWKKNVKDESLQILEKGIVLLSHLQDILFAQRNYGMLLILQAMDAAGKDGIIKHVLSGINPQGCQVTSFKTPSSNEIHHDFMWRCMCAAPERGMIGIFNRSYYEEVLSVKVHPEWLPSSGLPEECLGDKLWKGRYTSICDYEAHLTRNAIFPVKVFLHVSKEEQEKRFLKRIDLEEKNWKFSPNDLAERQYWHKYQEAFECMIVHTATKESPWYVVPADHKWFARLVTMCTLIETMSKMKLEYPEVSEEQRMNLQRIREVLLAGKTPSEGRHDDKNEKKSKVKKKKKHDQEGEAPVAVIAEESFSDSKKELTAENAVSPKRGVVVKSSRSTKQKNLSAKNKAVPLDVSPEDRVTQGMPPLKKKS